MAQLTGFYGYHLVVLKKTNLIFDLNSVVISGTVNHVPLNVNTDYLPNNDLVGEDSLDIVVKYGELEIPVVYDDNVEDYCFNLDLTDKIDNKSVKLTVKVNENDLVNQSITEVSLNCNYPSASSFTELQSQITNGAEIIELTDTITFENNLIIPHNIYIIGRDNTVYLRGFHMVVSSDVSVTGSGTSEDPYLIQ